MLNQLSIQVHPSDDYALKTQFGMKVGIYAM